MPAEHSPNPVAQLRRMLREWDDFISGSTSGSIGKLGWTMTPISAGTFSALAGLAGHPGVITIDSSATGSSAECMHLRATATTGVIDAAELWDCLFVFRCNQSDADAVFRVGLGNSPAAATPNDGVWLDRLGGETNWSRVSRATSTSTRTSTAIAHDTAWHSVRIRRISASLVGFTIDNAAEQTNSANIPATGTYLQPHFFVSNTAAAASKTMDCDAFGLMIFGLNR